MLNTDHIRNSVGFIVSIFLAFEIFKEIFTSSLIFLRRILANFRFVIIFWILNVLLSYLFIICIFFGIVIFKEFLSSVFDLSWFLLRFFNIFLRNWFITIKIKLEWFSNTDFVLFRLLTNFIIDVNRLFIIDIFLWNFFIFMISFMFKFDWFLRYDFFFLSSFF